jgi:hypothetical protein
VLARMTTRFTTGWQFLVYAHAPMLLSTRIPAQRPPR